MQYLNNIIISMICWQLTLFPSAINAKEIQKQKKQKHITNLVIKLIKAEMDQNTSFYYPQRYTAIQKETAGDEIVNMNNKIIEKLKDDSFSLNEIKEHIISSITMEEQNHLRELKYVLGRMDSETLDKIFFKSLKKGLYPKDLKEKYQYAYNLKEKKDVVLQMFAGDLTAIKSSSIKRIGMANREQLINELELTNSFFVIKGRNWKEIALIALTIALAGFATWGTFHLIKKSYAKKTKKMQEDFSDQETELEQEYAQKEAQLLAEFKEREALREEGYVWQVCSTTATTKSASCSYDYSNRSGLEVCTTRCLKNSQTGEETMHSTSCTSSFIPNNCFVKNPYDAGYDDGYDESYAEGYDRAYQRAYDDAYYQYYNDAYDSAWSRGYDWGYSSGYSDGLAEAEYDDSEYDDYDIYDDSFDDFCDPEYDLCKSLVKTPKKLSTIIKEKKSTEPNQIKIGYKKGYREGYAYAQLILIGL